MDRDIIYYDHIPARDFHPWRHHNLVNPRHTKDCERRDKEGEKVGC